MGHILLIIMLVVASLSGGASVSRAQEPEGFDGLGHVLPLIPGLVRVEAELPVLASPSAHERAATYARVIVRAEKYFNAKLGWKLPFRMLVLDRADWEKVAAYPYPAPHIWSRELLILMPQSLAEYPGFESWGFDDMKLNAMLTVHEMGHGLAHRNGLNANDADYAITEIIANILMAAFIYAEEPEMARLLEGAPAGFKPTAGYQLSDFDYYYGALGLHNYAWFQFELARAAGFMVRARPLPELVPVLVGSLNAGSNFLAEVNIGRLEGITPGVTATLANVLGPGLLPELQLGPCSGTLPDRSADDTATLFIENRSHVAAGIRDPVDERWLDDFNIELGKQLEKEPDVADHRPVMLAPGKWWSLRTVPGQDIVIEGRGCFRAHATDARAVIRDE